VTAIDSSLPFMPLMKGSYARANIALDVGMLR
jgi:hypothetical protein